MLTRNSRGKLALDVLSLECFFCSLFEECENDAEVDWLEEQIKGCLEVAKDDM